MVGQNRLRFVAQAHEEMNISGGAQHGASKELMGIGRNPLDFLNEGFADPPALISGTHGE